MTKVFVAWSRSDGWERQVLLGEEQTYHLEGELLRGAEFTFMVVMKRQSNVISR